MVKDKVGDMTGLWSMLRSSQFKCTKELLGLEIRSTGGTDSGLVSE